MSQPSPTPEERYAVLVAEMLHDPDITYSGDEMGPKKSFGKSELKVSGKIFAMLVRGRLVVKLPKARVDALVAAGKGERFDPRRDGRLMKEWLVIAPTMEDEWAMLAKEARVFVGAS